MRNCALTVITEGISVTEN